MLRCGRCAQTYPIVSGVPCLIPDPHRFPVWFLPPETLLPKPSTTLKERRHTDGLSLTVRKLGKEAFLERMRQAAARPPRPFEVPRSTLLNPTVKRRAHRHSRPAFITKVMEPVMRRRFWPDPGCVAMVKALEDLAPRRLLDIATGPGGLLCASLPRLKKTRAVGLEIYFESCRTVLAEAERFGFRGRLHMVHGDARIMPFADGTFDCVSGWTALYHISQYEAAIAELARVLRSGGHFVGTVHNEYPRHCPELLTASEEREMVRLARLPANLAEVCAALTSAGLVVSKLDPILHVHLVVATKP